MGPRQRPSAHVGGVNQPLGPERFYFRAFFHITQLPDVIVAPASLSAPAEEGVARGLEQSLTRHDALSHVFILALAYEWLQRGASGLLDLQDKRVFVAGHKQNDSAARPHASHADHLHGHVHYIEASQEEAQVVGQQRLVRFEGRAEIRKRISSWSSIPGEDPSMRNTSFIRHNLTTSRIELTGRDTARAKTYFVVFTDIGPDHSGTYSDELVRQDDRWLFAHRRIALDWRSSDSLFPALK